MKNGILAVGLIGFMVLLAFGYKTLVKDPNTQKEQTPNQQSQTQVVVPTKVVNNYQPKQYTSSPVWNSERDFNLTTSFGDVHIFNASNWELDTALLTELIEKNGTSFKSSVISLDLRIFNDYYVTEDPSEGFGLTTQEDMIGLTVTGGNIVITVIPTGWAFLSDGSYESDCEGVMNLQGVRPEEFVTMDIAHELIGHGILRVQNLERTLNEECDAQQLEREVYQDLGGRTLVRKKQIQ